MAPNQLGVRCLRRGSLTSLPNDTMCEQGWAADTDLEHLEDKRVPRPKCGTSHGHLQHLCAKYHKQYRHAGAKPLSLDLVDLGG